MKTRNVLNLVAIGAILFAFFVPVVNVTLSPKNCIFCPVVVTTYISLTDATVGIGGVYQGGSYSIAFYSVSWQL